MQLPQKKIQHSYLGAIAWKQAGKKNYYMHIVWFPGNINVWEENIYKQPYKFQDENSGRSLKPSENF